METIGLILAALLTVMVFSYILGDNPLFKLASHIFVGVAVGYAILVVVYEVFIPALTDGTLVATLPGLVLCLLLLVRTASPQGTAARAVGSVVLALIVGVGAALAIGGALFGTLLPQAGATAEISLNLADYPNTETEVGAEQWLSNVIIFLGTIGTFFYFTFAVRAQGPLGGLREGFVRFCAGMGRLIIIFTLAALFANAVSSRVALLVARLDFLAGLPQRLLGG